jgi:hypothetical protein
MHLASTLPCSAASAWAELRRLELLREVARPLVTFAAVDGEPLPERWAQGEVVRVRSYLLGVIPLGTRSLAIESVDEKRREIQTRERDPLIRRWDHRISIAPLGEQTCLYADEVEIAAGALTPLVWLFAQAFFRHRHRRWRRVAGRLRATAAFGQAEVERGAETKDPQRRM